ncbi:MAG: hypothetical protein OXH75_10815 [Acidobacteria bacterium]|nr:hypothetical protein [Acidobacteriota bacterium]
MTTTRTVDDHLTALLADAIARGAEPLSHVCRQLARELEAGDASPAEAARLLTAAAAAAPPARATTAPANLAALAEQMRAAERAFSDTSVPGDLVMMTATVHAHRCLDIGIRRAQAHGRN